MKDFPFKYVCHVSIWTLSLLIELLTRCLATVRASLLTPGQSLVHGWHTSQDSPLLDWYLYLSAWCRGYSCDLCYWFISGVFFARLCTLWLFFVCLFLPALI